MRNARKIDVLPVDPIPDFLKATPTRMKAIAALPPPKYQVGSFISTGKLKMRPPQEIKAERKAVAQAAAPTVQEAIAAGAHTMEALKAALPDMDESAITLGIELLKARKRVAPLAAAAKALAPPKIKKRGKTSIIKELLLRPKGCTRPEVLAATGWTAVSMQQQALACGLKLRQEKEKGKPTTYFGSI